MEKSQKEYYLNEQMKAIQKELGDNDEEGEISDYMAKIEKAKLSKEAKEKALAEVKKLKNMSGMSSEATVIRNYLDWLLDIPWKKRSKVNKDISKAMEVLEKDHYGLEKVKERIVEYLAVQSRADKIKGPILCLVGPPGVGKTSLGKSIAKATGRSFVRASLGGMRDEAEIRGHRRTYIGSMPGKIIKGMKKAGTSNPVSYTHLRAHETGRRPERPIRCFCLMKLTSLAMTGAAIRVRLCWRCWIRSKMRHLTTIIWKSITICRTLCL